MTKKLAWPVSRRFTLGAALAAAVIGAGAISLTWATAQDQVRSNAPANEQPLNPPRTNAAQQPIPGIHNPFDDEPTPRTVPSPSITSPAPLQGPDGAMPQGGVPQTAPRGAERENQMRERNPSGAQSGRMPGMNPFDAGPGKPDHVETPDMAAPGNDNAQPSATYSEAEEAVNAGRELLKTGKYEEAMQRFAEAQKLDPKEPTPYFYQGIVYRQLGRFDDAIDSFSIAASLTTDDLENLAETYLRRGIVWFYKGEYGIAWDDFDEAATNCADNDPRPDLWKGLAKAKQNRWLEAVNSFADSLARNDHFAPAYLNRGLAYMMLNEPKKAVDDFEQAIRQEPHNAASYVKRGVAQARLGKHREAADSYSHAIQLDPKNAEAYFNRSIAHRQLGDSQQADKDRTKAHELDANIEQRAKSAG
jgi:tetratricopeptide (TPR) repeat protein